ncbi:hypothetical protein Tco_0003637 [Tanacetum coccineum]
MGDEIPIRTLGDCSKPSHEGYRNTIELPVMNNMVPLRSDTIWLVQNGAHSRDFGWDDTKELVKPVKAITTPQGITKTPDLRLLELEDQINFLLKGSRSAPLSSSTHNPQAYVNAT